MTARSAKTRSFRSALASFASMLDGASACARAAEGGRRPSREALRALGIDAAQWDRIGTR